VNKSECNEEISANIEKIFKKIADDFEKIRKLYISEKLKKF
jgi:hypothetical protein